MSELVRALSRFVGQNEGSISKGQDFTIADPARAEHLEKLGLIIRLDKNMENKGPHPSSGDGAGAQSQSSPAGRQHPLSKERTVSSTGQQLSSSTTPGDSAPKQKSSTPATPAGGKSTEKPSPKASEVKGGRKTAPPPKKKA